MHAIHDLVIILLEVHTMGAFVPLAQRYMLRHITTAILEASPWKQPKCPLVYTKHRKNISGGPHKELVNERS